MYMYVCSSRLIWPLLLADLTIWLLLAAGRLISEAVQAAVPAKLLLLTSIVVVDDLLVFFWNRLGWFSFYCLAHCSVSFAFVSSFYYRC